MRRVQPVSVHIAVLSVAKDPKHPDHNAIAAAIERATGAGHKVVEQATVKDSEPAVREQLTRFITDSNVDVVLVLGGADSETASTAMKPLVSSVLPGFTDLFRWLAFQEIGASAMLSQAEAAQCGQAYVFVLPGAIAAAMDKLILPQLDPNTTPKNLVGALPHLQARIAVPTAIHGEKTQGGAGLPPKLPAMPLRKQTKTGANIIPRNRAVDDPPTKPIDLERLQKEIERSEASDQQTRRTDLAKLLPKLPPGADEYLEPDADEDLTDAELLAAPPPIGMKGPRMPQTPAERARHEAATPPSPAPVVVPPAALKPMVPAVIPPIAPGPRRAPTQPPPAPLRPASSPTTAGGLPPRPPAQIPSLVKPGTPTTTPLPSIAKPASAGTSALSAAWGKSEDTKTGAFVDAKTAPTGGAWIEAKTTPTGPMRTTPSATTTGPARTTPSAATPPAGTPVARVTPVGRPTPPGGLPPRPPGAPSAEAVDTKTLPIARIATSASERVATPAAGMPATSNRIATPAAGTPASKRIVTPPAGTPASEARPASGATNGARAQMNGASATSTMSASSVATSPGTSTSSPVAAVAASISKPIADSTSASPSNAATPGEAAATTPAGPSSSLTARAPTAPIGSGGAITKAPKAGESKTPTTELDPSELTDAIDDAEPVESDAASTTSPAPVATAAPSQRIPRSRPPTPPPMPAVRTRQPTPPPMPAVKVPVVADVAVSRTSSSDLPRGTFSYPVQRKRGGLALKLFALVAAAGLGFVAFVYLVPMFMKKEPAPTTTAEATPPPTPTPPPVETPPVETPPVETPPVETLPVETPVETPLVEAKPTQKPTQKPTRPNHSSAAVKPAESPELKPMPKPETKPATRPVEEPVVDDGCDETSCILSKYEKACCAKYKPTSSDLSARTGGGLPENLDKMMVRAGVEKVKPRVVSCGEKAAVKGTVKIALTVSPAGAVTSAEVADTPDAGLGTCVLGAMKSATFGKSVNGGTFTYPFAF